MRTHAHAAHMTRVYERGGLTSSGGLVGAVVERFAYCEHCDIETPIDSESICTYCFKPVVEDDE